MNSNRRSGLTLLELLVVLVILAIMTTVAVQSTDMLVDQGRYDATRQTLQNIQDAIIGPANLRDSDGSQTISGFVADMGRLPQPVYAGGVLQGDPLRELWDNTVIPAGSGYGIQLTNVPLQTVPPTTPVLLTAPSPGGTAITLRMPCGWRGPYLRLPSGSNGRLIDGWGNPFDSFCYQTSPAFILNTPPLPGQSITLVRSRGADGLVDTPPFPSGFAPLNLDMYAPDQGVPPVAFSSSPLAPSPSFSDKALGSVTVTLQEFNSYTGMTPILTGPVPTTATATTEAVQVVLLAPVNGILTPFAPNIVMVGGVTNPPASPTAVTLSGTTGPSITMSFLNVPVGPRAVQAFHFNTSNGAVLKSSPILYLTVPPGGVPSKTLILQ